MNEALHFNYSSAIIGCNFFYIYKDTCMYCIDTLESKFEVYNDGSLKPCIL
jgi:hypothetical protein